MSMRRSFRGLVGALCMAALAACAGCAGWEPMDFPKPASETPEGDGVVKKALDAYIDSRVEKSKQ